MTDTEQELRSKLGALADRLFDGTIVDNQRGISAILRLTLLGVHDPRDTPLADKPADEPTVTVEIPAGGIKDGQWRLQAMLDLPVIDDHYYLSTACRHDEHDYCKSYTGKAGNKIPAQCKFCAAPCRCPCHVGEPT